MTYPSDKAVEEPLGTTTEPSVDTGVPTTKLIRPALVNCTNTAQNWEDPIVIAALVEVEVVMVPLEDGNVIEPPPKSTTTLLMAGKLLVLPVIIFGILLAPTLTTNVELAVNEPGGVSSLSAEDRIVFRVVLAADPISPRSAALFSTCLLSINVNIDIFNYFISQVIELSAPESTR